MRDSRELKEIARRRLTGYYWQTLLVFVVSSFETFAGFLANLFVRLRLPAVFQTARHLPLPTFRYNYEVSRGISAGRTSGTRFSFNFPPQKHWFLFLYGFVAPVLLIGYARYNLKLLRGEHVEISDVFSRMHLFLRSLWLYILYSLICAFWFLMFFLGGLLIGWLFNFNQSFLLFWGALSLIPAIVAGLAYSMSFLIFADNPDLTAQDALRKSRELMDGQKARLFALLLTFIGWVILDAFLWGLVMLWIYPYIGASIAAFYIDIIEPEGLVLA